MVTLHLGDSRLVMASMEDASVDAVVCDPPYELGFMGKSWDATGIAYSVKLWSQVLRVLKPGGHLLAFSGTRTYHRMTCAIEDAGFEIRDCIMWCYGSGFPKSLDVSKAIDKAAGAKREVVGVGGRSGTARHAMAGDFVGSWDATAPATDDARRWSGWGTALKPAWEPVVVARKPLEGTVAANVLAHGTGALNIDGCRVATGEGDDFAKAWDRSVSTNIGAKGGSYITNGEQHTLDLSANKPEGRWPANMLLSCSPACKGDTHAEGCPCALMDGQSDGASRFFNRLPIIEDDYPPFFYVAKASRSEREAGCDDLPSRSGADAVEREDGSAGTESPRAGAGRTASSVRNHHPTVKPSAVMAHLVRLVTPKGGVVLDPFMGSGSTGIACVREGMSFIGIDQSTEYVEIARARIKHAAEDKQLRLT